MSPDRGLPDRPWTAAGDLARAPGTAYNRGMTPPGDSHARVKHELLVRLLDATAPALLHSGRRFAYADGYARDATALAALRVFGEFADRLRGRLAVVLAGDVHPERLAPATAGLPATVTVDVVPGPCDRTLVPALRAAGAFGGPILAYLDSAGADPPTADTLAVIATGKRADLLVVADPDRLGDDGITGYADKLARTGLDRVARVELVDGSGYRQVVFYATATDRGLDRFKDLLWALDEFAGIRYRDPGDPDGALLDISLEPHLGPLRRALLDQVPDAGCTAGDLRGYTRLRTVFRGADAFRAITALVASGRLARTPERGRLTADTMVYRT